MRSTDQRLSRAGSARQAIVIAALVLAAVYGTSAAAAPRLDAPFLHRNTGALSATAGLPRVRDARLPGAGVAQTQFLTELASQFTEKRDGADSARIDVETTTTVFTFERGLSERLALYVEVPLVRQDGGFLDGFINDYHDLLSLPDGGRDRARDDQVDVFWNEGGTDRLRLGERRSGLGDVRLGLAIGLDASERSHTTLRASVELPTGSPGALAGNDALDVAVAVHHRDAALLSGLGLTLQSHLGLLTRIGDDAILGDDAEDLVVFGGLGLAWPVSERLTLKAQLDAHDDLADTPLKPVGGWSVQGTLGGSLLVGEALAVEFAVAEDLRPGSASDVAFLLSLSASVE